jgi:hypothetical protein
MTVEIAGSPERQLSGATSKAIEIATSSANVWRSLGKRRFNATVGRWPAFYVTTNKTLHPPTNPQTSPRLGKGSLIRWSNPPAWS